MQLRLLETLHILLERGTTLAAAEELGVSQSAVSRRLSQLEGELGLTLFVRDKGRLVPTRESLALRGQVRALVEQGGRLTQRVADMRRGELSETLGVAFPASLTLSIVPSIIADFVEDHPGSRIELHTGAYDTIERMLLDGRAEIGFVRIPTHNPELDTTPLIEARTVCVIPEDHPLAARDLVSIHDLHREPLILLGRQRIARREIDEAFFEAGVWPRVRVEAHSVQSACALAAQGLGVTLVNELMAKDYARMPIVVRPLKEHLVHRFVFATNGRISQSIVGRAFVAAATRYFHEVLEVSADAEGIFPG